MATLKGQVATLVQGRVKTSQHCDTDGTSAKIEAYQIAEFMTIIRRARIIAGGGNSREITPIYLSEFIL